MVKLTDKEKEVLQRFKEKLASELGERLDAAQLFGSKARGEANKFSDIDVLVVVRDATWRDRRTVSGITSDILLSDGIFISPKVLSPIQLEKMKNRRSMFWQSIKPDLLAI